MLQEGSVTFVLRQEAAPLETWHFVVAVLTFAVWICGFVWWSRLRSGRNAGTLNLGGRGEEKDGGS